MSKYECIKYNHWKYKISQDILLILICSGMFIIGLNNNVLLGTLFGKRQSDNEDNRFFYTVTETGCSAGYNDTVTFFQIGPLVYFNIQSVDNYVFRDQRPMTYNITKVDDYYTLNIVGHVEGYIHCIQQHQIFGFLIRVTQQIDSVEFHTIDV